VHRQHQPEEDRQAHKTVYLIEGSGALMGSTTSIEEPTVAALA